jgi:hypothetical protein
MVEAYFFIVICGLAGKKTNLYEDILDDSGSKDT